MIPSTPSASTCFRQSGVEDYLEEPYGEPVTNTWYGWRPMTYDSLPIIGPCPGNNKGNPCHRTQHARVEPCSRNRKTSCRATYRQNHPHRDQALFAGTVLASLASYLFAVGLDFPVLDKFAGPVGHVLHATEGLGKLKHLCPILSEKKSQTRRSFPSLPDHTHDRRKLTPWGQTHAWPDRHRHFPESVRP